MNTHIKALVLILLLATGFAMAGDNSTGLPSNTGPTIDPEILKARQAAQNVLYENIVQPMMAFDDVFTILPESDPNIIINALVAQNTGITVKSINFTGADGAIGLYYNGPSNMGDGIILASGFVSNALPPDDSPGMTTDFGLPGCDFCNLIIPGYTSNDAAILEITFDVSEACSTISFDFIFGSEEYPEWVGSAFNDVYGAYLNGVQISFDNDGYPITINGPFFSSGYVQTPPGNGMEYDGSTPKLKTIKPVIPGSTDNTLVFVVCDAGDHILDSGALLANLRGSKESSDTTATGIAPSFNTSPESLCGDTIYVGFDEGIPVGYQSISFDIEAYDIGPDNDMVTLSVGDLPDGAFIEPELPQTGNPVVATFHWVPIFGQAGTYEVTFKATDANDALFEECTVVIIVPEPSVTGCLNVTAFVEDQAWPGIMTELFDELGNFIMAVPTADNGTASFDDLAYGNYEIKIEIPLGMNSESEFQIVTIPPIEQDFCAEAEFYLYDITSGKVRGASWWIKQFQTIDNGGVPFGGYTCDSIDCFLGKVFDHFYDRNDGNGIAIENVTYKNNPPEPLTFDDMVAQFLGSCDNSLPARIEKQLLLAMLNVASLRLSQKKVITEDGTTVSQCITAFSKMYLDGFYDYWYYVSSINYDWTIPAGIVPLATPNIMYKPEDSFAEINLPTEFVLAQNYPNPFNPVTTISFVLPERSEVILEIYNIMGQKVATVANGVFEVGSHCVTWDASKYSSGVYLYKLTADEFEDIKKMLLVK